MCGSQNFITEQIVVKLSSSFPSSHALYNTSGLRYTFVPAAPPAYCNLPPLSRHKDV